jgi:hypothetical protein
MPAVLPALKPNQKSSGCNASKVDQRKINSDGIIILEAIVGLRRNDLNAVRAGGHSARAIL